MKTAIVLVVLGMTLLHAEALKCRKSVCSGTKLCTTTTITCDRDVALCFVMTLSKPTFTLIRGCTTEAYFYVLKGLDPNVYGCSKDLCN
ncbi:hypothetical protein XELAEV_18023882mg [Xenopus laevis]|uniref:UPAR/Ly6 domain-containing protein n=1 Tax=Xenopus laevis TaxID=8355 RepID=A0A974HQ17_XENLA|nr:hypothetical protein XELAEV_18023882mg [Xenopus laevis]